VALPTVAAEDIAQYLRAHAASLESATSDNNRHLPPSVLYPPPLRNSPSDTEVMRELMLRYGLGGNTSAIANQRLVAASSIPSQPQDMLSSSSAASLVDPFYRNLSTTQNLSGKSHSSFCGLVFDVSFRILILKHSFTLSSPIIDPP
jgi:hypothetical protein